MNPRQRAEAIAECAEELSFYRDDAFVCMVEDHIRQAILEERFRCADLVYQESRLYTHRSCDRHLILTRLEQRIRDGENKRGD